MDRKTFAKRLDAAIRSRRKRGRNLEVLYNAASGGPEVLPLSSPDEARRRTQSLLVARKREGLDDVLLIQQVRSEVFISRKKE